MASGDLLFSLSPAMMNGPGTNFATPVIINDTSTPPLDIPGLAFDGVTEEYADFYVEIPSNYSGTTGFTFQYKGAVDGTDVDIIDMEFRVLPIVDGDIMTGDLGIDTQTAVSIQDTPVATSTNKMMYSPTGALAKASFGDPSVGDLIVIRVSRDVAAATNTDDFQLAKVKVTET